MSIAIDGNNLKEEIAFEAAQRGFKQLVGRSDLVKDMELLLIRTPDDFQKDPKQHISRVKLLSVPRSDQDLVFVNLDTGKHETTLDYREFPSTDEERTHERCQFWK